MEYYLFVSNDCNLNCSYCSVLLKKESCNIPKEPVYSIDELNHFIDKTQKKYNDKIADIVFFGGEPTLNYNFIEKLISSQDKLANLSYEFHYMLHTNGILLKDLSYSILKHLDSIMLSINYDKIPRFQLNNSYFKIIIDSVCSIKQRKPIPIVARLTITEETSLFAEIALLNPFFDAIYWQIENKYKFNDFISFYSSYKYEIELSFQTWLSYLKRGILLRLIPFIAAFYFISNEHQVNDFCCGYNSSMIYIQTNGQCYTCAEDMTTQKNYIGQIIDEIRFDEFKLTSTICTSCEFLSICMGRCGRMHREFDENHVKEYCKLNQVLFNLINNHKNEIRQQCKEHHITISLDDPIYHYTEYTP